MATKQASISQTCKYGDFDFLENNLKRLSFTRILKQPSDASPSKIFNFLPTGAMS